MKKIFFTIFFLYFMLYINVVSAFDIFGFDAKLEKRNRELNNSISKEFSDINAELGVIKNNQLNLRADVKAELKARATIGQDRSSNQDIRAGEDVNITNDTGLLKSIIGALAGIIIILILSNIVVIKNMFKYLKEKKDFKRKYYETEKKLNGRT